MVRSGSDIAWPFSLVDEVATRTSYRLATPQIACGKIDSIQPGDFITALHSSGETVTVKVQSVFVTDNRLWKVDTEAGVLFTTQTQPLCLTAERTLPAGELQAGDKVLRLQDGKMHAVKVFGVSPTDRKEKVFNLILGHSEVFIAGGFLARSKPPAAIATR